MLWFGGHDWRLKLAALALIGCNPPQVAGSALQGQNTQEAFGTCDPAHPPREPDLMAWEPSSRAALAAVRHQGVAVVHYEARGCDVKLELLTSCFAKGQYDYLPYWETKSKVANNASDLSAKLPVGGASLSGALKGNRSLRTDYMLAGMVQSPLHTNFQVNDLVGDCSRATHLVTRIYLGGFAMAAGEARSIQAAATLFGAGVSANSNASLEQLERAGDPAACEASHQSQTENVNCAVPLRVSLRPLEQARACSEATECQARCAASEMSACMMLGGMYLGGNGVAKDERRAVALFKQACDGGNQEGCGNLGICYANGTGITPDPYQGFALLNQACSRDIVWACGDLAGMYENGLGVGKDLVRAAALYGQVCEAGDAEMCRRRFPLLQPECDSGQAEDCLALAKMYGKGQGVPTDYQAALQLLQRACAHGSDDACTEVGTFFLRGLGVAKDTQKAMSLYQAGCDKGSAPTCRVLGYFYYAGEEVQRDFKLAAAALDRGCKLGDAMSCAGLGELYQEGQGVPSDLARALRLFVAACDGGYAGGCSSLASMYEQGNGVPADPARALALHRQACSGGEEDSCRAVTRLTAR
jgi:uncharacterized protein